MKVFLIWFLLLDVPQFNRPLRTPRQEALGDTFWAMSSRMDLGLSPRLRRIYFDGQALLHAFI